MTAIAEAARFLAEQWPVFACNGDKRPITPQGLKNATRDLAELSAMFRRPGAEMIGVPTGAASGFVVLDLDCKGGAPGLEWLAANEHRLPPTRRHLTRSGGQHLLFNVPRGRRIRNSASKIAPGVDVRGEGGYVIVPPSPGYSVSHDAMPAEVPEWLIELLDPPAPPPPEPLPRASGSDSHGNGSRYGLTALEEECDAILRAPFGQQESTLNGACVKIGALVGGGELAEDFAISQLYAAACGMPDQPGRDRWDRGKLRDKVARAVADGRRSPRQAPPREVRHVVRVEIAAPEPPPRDEPPEHWQAEQEPAGDAGRRADAPAPRPRKPALRVSVEPWREDLIPPRPWVVRGYFLRGAVTVIAGPGSAGKSSLMVAWSVAAALGVEFGRFRPAGPLRVLTYNVEDDEDEQRRRISAACRQFCANPAAVAPSIMRVGPEDVGTLIEHDQFLGRFRYTPAWEDLTALIDGFEPDIVLLDPLAELHTAEESDNTALRHVIAHIRGLARQKGFACGVVHHTRKGAEAGDMDAVRGASSLVGAARSVFTVTPMSKDEAGAFGVAAALRRQFFRLDNAKANYVEAGEAEWHELQAYELDNRESVAAALPWTPPKTGGPVEIVAPDVMALMLVGVARGTLAGPYSSKLSLKEPRSVAQLFVKHGVKEAKDQKALLNKLLEDGCTVQEYRDAHGRLRDGMRGANGGPDARWIEAEGSGAQSESSGGSPGGRAQ